MNFRCFITLLLIFSFLSNAESFPFRKKKKEVMEDYYANGLLKYRSITYVYGVKDDEFSQFAKTKVLIWEYYENGVRELEQKVIERPASGKRNETTGQPMNRIPKKVRKYKRYDHGGNLTEKGWDKTRKSKNVMYNIDIYKKVVTKKNQLWRYPKVRHVESQRGARTRDLDYMNKKKGGYLPTKKEIKY